MRSLLHADPVTSSLQVVPAGSTEWLNADRLTNCLVVNIGSMWEIWTGGLYPATLHRVIHKAPNYSQRSLFLRAKFPYQSGDLTGCKKGRCEGREEVDRGEEEVVHGDFLLNKIDNNLKY